MKLRRFYTVMSIAIACCELVGCATTTYEEPAKPTDYQYFPEYGGWVPIIRDACRSCELYKSEIGVSYVSHMWQPRIDGGIDFTTDPRADLPATEVEARSIVDQNLSVARNVSRNKAAKAIITSPVMVSAILIGWSPPMSILLGYSERHHNDRNISVAPTVANTGLSESEHGLPLIKHGGEAVPTNESGIKVRVIDNLGRPVVDAEVVPIFSPIPFRAYADDALRRPYAHGKFTYQFDVSSEFAAKLANFLGIEEAPRGTRTADNGTQVLPLPKWQLDGVRVVHVLAHKTGFTAGVASIPVSKIDPSNVVTIILSEERGPSVANVQQSINPWIISRDLERQVKCYVTKYDRDPKDKDEDSSATIIKPVFPSSSYDSPFANWKECKASPPLEFERFEKYTLDAYKFAPNYPLVQSAMFFYELERGNVREAKKYSRFIDDSIYIKVFYHMSGGEQMRYH